MRVVLFALLAVSLYGCAPSVVGAIDLTETPQIERRGTLLLVPVSEDQMPRPRLNPTPADNRRARDSMRVAEWVPRDSLRGVSYQAYAVEAIAQAIRDTGTWAEVRVGRFPEGLSLSEQTYAIKGFTKTRSRAAELRTGVVAPPAGQADVFGADVDHVAFLVEPSLGFAESQESTPIGFGPVVNVGPIGIGASVQGDDSVAIGSDVIVWDNRGGYVVTYGHVEGAAAIRSKMVSSAQERTAPVLLRGARENLAARLASELEVLVGE